jgi:hypothetical protein
MAVGAVYAALGDNVFEDDYMRFMRRDAVQIMMNAAIVGDDHVTFLVEQVLDLRRLRILTS